MTDEELYKLGLSKVSENKLLEAIDLFTKAIELNSANPHYFNERAVCYLNTGKFDLSMFDMNKSIELDDKYAYFYSCRAYLKSKMRDMDGAVADYEISLELDPHNDITYNNMAVALESIGNMNKAQRYYKKANEILGYDPEKRVLSEDGKTMVDKAPSSEKSEKLAKHIQELKSESTQNTPSKSKIAKDVFTKKSVFKEFLGFIANGFKLKQNDESREC